MQMQSRYLKPVEGDGGEDGGAPAEVEEDVDPSAGMSEDEINDLLGEDSSDEEVEDSPPAESEEAEEAAPEEEVESEVETELEESPIDDPQPDAEQEVEEQVQQPEVNPTAEEIEKQKVAWLNKLTERYSISDEDAEALITEPETVLPKLAANIHSAVMVDMTKALEQILPQMVGQFIQAQPQVVSNAMQSYQQQADAKTQFFESFPALKGNENVVKVAAQTVEQNFPEMSQADQLQKVGQIALAMLGITPQAAPAPKEEEPAPAPFTPAKSGSAPPPAPKQEGNVWDEFLN